MTIKLNTAKAWVALAFMIITAIMQSNVIPASGRVHTWLTVVSIIIGAISTWAMPANPKVISNDTNQRS